VGELTCGIQAELGEEFYKTIGAPELGFLLTCSADFQMAEGFGANVQLTRTQTIMQGASRTTAL